MRSAITRFSKFFRLSPPERVILGEACGLFLLVDLALRILTFKQLLALGERLFVWKPVDAPPALVPSVSRVVWLVQVAGRYAPVRVTCLKQALVLRWILGRRGIPAVLRIGVSREEGRFKAHAWLEYQGQTILGPVETDGYLPLASVEAGGGITA